MSAKRNYIVDLIGTFKNTFRIATTMWKDNSGQLEALNKDGVTAIPVKASSLKMKGATSGESELQAPVTSGVVLVLPNSQGASGQALLGDGAGNLYFATVGTGGNQVKIDEQVINFGSSSPVVIFAAPAGVTIEKVLVEIETSFDGTPTLSVGIVGTPAKYMGTGDNDLTDVVNTTFEVSPIEEETLAQTVQVTYVAGGATVGSARVQVMYVNPD